MTSKATNPAKARYMNSEKGKAKTKEYNLRYVRSNPAKFFADISKAKPCMDCGGRFPCEVMEYDHRPGTDKVGDVAVMCRRKRSVKLIQDEINKCDLVCANCHRIRTLNRRLDASLS